MLPLQRPIGSELIRSVPEDAPGGPRSGRAIPRVRAEPGRPPGVTLAMANLAGTVEEGLLAMAVGTGFAVMEGVRGKVPSAMDPEDGYRYDVFVSYPRRGDVEIWVRKHLVPRLERALQENLARADIYIDHNDTPTGVAWPAALENALRRSRVLLAVFSKQYFKKPWCRAEIDSMIKRYQELGFGTSANPRILVHAIVAQDCDDEKHIPAEYHEIQRELFKTFVYDFKDTDWAFYKPFQDAINKLAEDLAETVEAAPAWDPSFPVVRPDVDPPDRPTVPTF